MYKISLGICGRQRPLTSYGRRCSDGSSVELRTLGCEHFDHSYLPCSTVFWWDFLNTAVNPVFRNGEGIEFPHWQSVTIMKQ
jgi:hypothetical protein